MLSTCVCVCVCVCVIFLHHSVWKVKSVVWFYSCILLLWYVGYDDFTSMNNVFVLMIFISLLVLLLANMKIAILEKYLFSISDEFLYFFLFFHFVFLYLLSVHISDKFLFFCFSLFWCLHFVSNSFTLSVCLYFFLWFSLSLFLFLF